MNKKVIGILVVTLFVSTAILSVIGIGNVSNVEENECTLVEYISTVNDELDLAIDSSEYIISDNFNVVIDPSDSGKVSSLSDPFVIYEGLHWQLTVTARWDPPNPSKQICLWADTATLPAGATFPECVCDYGEVSGVLDWTPSFGQAGTYQIVFYVGESCYDPIGYLTVTVIVYPYNPDPQNTYEICAGQYWNLAVTARWDPFNPSKPICMWICKHRILDGNSALQGICLCGYGEVTIDFYLTPSFSQIGEHIITFYVGEVCGEYTFPFSIRVVVIECEDQNIEFCQMDFNLDGDIITDSSWGTATIVSESDDGIMYINLAVNGRWVVQNLPFMPVGDEFALDFDLGVENGVEVTQLEYAYEITSYTLNTMPSDFQTATVADGSVVMYSGEIDETAVFSIPGTLIGWLFVDFAWHDKDDIFNQPCGIAECVPAAISNSLKMLKKKHNLNWNDNDISIDKMKTATGWNNGCPFGWWNTKKEKMKNLVTTTIYDETTIDQYFGK